MPGTPPMLQPRRVRPLKIAVPLAVLGAFFVYTYHVRGPRPAGRPTARLAGLTMGTTYSVRWVDPRGATQREDARIAADVEGQLARVSALMSTYDPASEISRFNAAPAGAPFPVSPAFAGVVRASLAIARASGGAFDPTVGPLVDLWGFGPNGRRAAPPTPENLAEALPLVGHALIEVVEANDGPALRKARDGVRLDLSAIAKGYGADAVADALRTHGLADFFVEVGGEVVTAGRNGMGRPWRIGVDLPRFDALPGEAMEGVLHLDGQAVATSGDYRNYFRDETTGDVYAHILDPREGRPTRRAAGSVTVVAADGMTADGLATALYVMGPDEGLPWLAAAYPGVEALFLVREADGAIVERPSPGFAALTAFERRAPKRP